MIICANGCVYLYLRRKENKMNMQGIIVRKSNEFIDKTKDNRTKSMFFYEIKYDYLYNWK